ncbi:N-acetylglucosamine-6-phosphate deacetylase [Metabacillus sp. 84]|uniref:N-acetylglucosamine-6-phosphate deacetylase n=1 Tax=Metabacillus sp. 84 TaxID=3404705 RepID=UPI003CF4677A
METNKPLLLTNLTIYAEDRTIENGYLRLKNEKIADYGSLDGYFFDEAEYERVIKLSPSFSLIPGMIDVHVHGAGGCDTMDAVPDALKTIAETLAQEGTTGFLATTITQDSHLIEKALCNAAEYIGAGQEPGKAEVLGVHLEGPFISRKRAGAQPLSHIKEPDTEVFKNWQELSKGHIKLVTLAPEEPGAHELIRHLKASGAVASIGHSDATYEQVEEAINAGAAHVTHLFNGMRGIHHREPGVMGAALLRDELTVELITDGIHARPEMILLAYKQKPKENVILITDSLRAKCMAPGTYDLGGQHVTVTETKAALEDGTLAGSMLKMKDALVNYSRFTNCTMEELILAVSTNPARQLNVLDRKGSIAEGKDADLVILNKEKEVVMTICRGKIAFEKGGVDHGDH